MRRVRMRSCVFVQYCGSWHAAWHYSLLTYGLGIRGIEEAGACDASSLSQQGKRIVKSLPLLSNDVKSRRMRALVRLARPRTRRPPIGQGIAN